MYGRGERHLTAVLDENDVVVYQTGTWLVDGVSVGEGRAGFAYAQVETIQLVWTHNCEHGVVRGLALELVHDKDNADSPPIFVRHQFDQIEFGPEQLLAKIPVEWVNDSQGETKASCRALVSVNDQHWQDFLV
ncbi:predicted protein [Phaeodactylum tricornutum CCAP 1055/1]|jgi:hypothetical protein|uniref:Uncharacterized protein n=2 Tax=Phaeodactylum tricornutum TaxID=2850 RepID=B7G2R2_PHATC|nr:predicted protein [Phaeodactylum tricornutum CCAP 1055/1]EEC47348.1 predicted protein [Phaeodactylum tricornutum CCAP 1055/1]|eukprot:XP_002181425.1 predicted protein [Phaeodactylum tricornutum CCAP 1055/1]